MNRGYFQTIQQAAQHVHIPSHFPRRNIAPSDSGVRLCVTTISLQNIRRQNQIIGAKRKNEDRGSTRHLI